MNTRGNSKAFHCGIILIFKTAEETKVAIMKIEALFENLKPKLTIFLSKPQTGLGKNLLFMLSDQKEGY